MIVRRARACIVEHVAEPICPDTLAQAALTSCRTLLGMEGNWVQSLPGKSWFSDFRLCGPTEPFFKRSWALDDFEEVKVPALPCSGMARRKAPAVNGSGAGPQDACPG